MNLVKCREVAKRKPGNKTQSFGSINLERICYEALLFHGVTRMLVDPTFDLLGPEWDVVCDYFHRAEALETDERHWPVLGMPFGVFKITVAASRLTRQNSLADSDVETARESLKQLLPWYNTLPKTDEFSTTYLYIVSAHKLLRYIIDRGSGITNRLEEIHENEKGKEKEAEKICNTDNQVDKIHDIEKEVASVTAIMQLGVFPPS